MDLPVKCLREMVACLTARKVRFSLIGGSAAGFRSRPRFTRDIDFLLEIPHSNKVRANFPATSRLSWNTPSCSRSDNCRTINSSSGCA